MYYFAYGSNMDENDLKNWCEKMERSFPKWTLLGTACLNGYKLSFNYYSKVRKGGAANIMEFSDSKVYGLLFEINNKYDIETIRKKEGYPKCYGEIEITVKHKDKNIVNVKTYKVLREKELLYHQKPTEYYMNLILKNARIHGFPYKYIRYLESIRTK